MGPRDRYDPIDAVVEVLRHLFDCAPLTEDAALPDELRELAFTRDATCFLIHHGRACGDTVALLVSNELLESPDLEAVLRSADLPALVAEHPRGIIGVGDFGAMVLGEK